MRRLTHAENRGDAKGVHERRPEFRSRAAALLAIGAACLLPACGCERGSSGSSPARETPAQSSSANAIESPPQPQPSMAPRPAAPSSSSPAAAPPASAAGPSEGGAAPAASGSSMAGPGAGVPPSAAPPAASGAPPVQEIIACPDNPAIERWAQKRSLEPLLVKAFIVAQSGGDACAAGRACREGYDGPGCMQPGVARDEGYSAGFDEMHDPDGRCPFTNAPAGAGDADWRFIGLGLMGGVEPPYTFWPSDQHPDGTDGAYADVMARSGLSGVDFGDARACNPRFNPFNADDSICLGTSRLERYMRAAKAWVAANRQSLGIDTPEKERRLLTYIAGSMYSGVWFSKSRSLEHPRCAPGSTNGACWTSGFVSASAATESYCGSPEGRNDTERCESGRPRANPPAECNGFTDFVSFVRSCELPYLPSGRDMGFAVLEIYGRLKRSCGQR